MWRQLKAYLITIFATIFDLNNISPNFGYLRAIHVCVAAESPPWLDVGQVVEPLKIYNVIIVVFL